MTSLWYEDNPWLCVLGTVMEGTLEESLLSLVLRCSVAFSIPYLSYGLLPSVSEVSFRPFIFFPRLQVDLRGICAHVRCTHICVCLGIEVSSLQGLMNVRYLPQLSTNLFCLL